MPALTSSGLHCHEKDDINVFNAVVLLGNFTKGKLLLLNLKLWVQLCHGNVILFYGSVFYHDVTTVNGNSNSVNLFYHYTSIIWAKKMIEQKTVSECQAKQMCHGQNCVVVDKKGR